MSIINNASPHFLRYKSADGTALHKIHISGGGVLSDCFDKPAVRIRDNGLFANIYYYGDKVRDGHNTIQLIYSRPEQQARILEITVTAGEIRRVSAMIPHGRGDPRVVEITGGAVTVTQGAWVGPDREAMLGAADFINEIPKIYLAAEAARLKWTDDLYKKVLESSAQLARQRIINFIETFDIIFQ